MPQAASVSKTAAPGRRKRFYEGEIAVRVVLASNQQRWKPQTRSRNRSESCHAFGPTLPLDIGGCDEKRAGSRSNVPLVTPVSHGNAAETVRHQDHRPLRASDGLIQC